MHKLTPRSFAASLALCALLSAPAFAADTPQPPPGAPPEATQPATATPAPGSPDEVICKTRSEPVTGTKISKKTKICRTRREWDEQQRIGQNTLGQIQKSGGGQSGLLPMGPAGRGAPRGN